ncbi:hypothetical protein [Phormidium sp. CCY1219]|uniref:hypothetical protein n=1 Tax=Phormidium sp. CCY1219 TaxID=2886104 RepID=UPI002D1F8B4C|nr:hypothetical protein [Phormidium sp. CCY1219]MEB3830380.1 hypothetical protein [Phormidium sp. CCY1219]
MGYDGYSTRYSLWEAVEDLAETTVSLGVIPGFVVRYFPDGRHFYIPDEIHAEPLSAEQAYFHLKALVEESGVLTDIVEDSSEDWRSPPLGESVGGSIPSSPPAIAYHSSPL